MREQQCECGGIWQGEPGWMYLYDEDETNRDEDLFPMCPSCQATIIAQQASTQRPLEEKSE